MTHLALHLLGAASVLTLTVAPSAAAQGGEAACSFDTAAVTRPVSVAIGLVATPGRETPAQQSLRRVYAAQAIAEHFEPPATVSLPLWARVQPPAPDSAQAPQGQTSNAVGNGLHSELVFHLTPEGRLRDTTIELSTLSPEINAALRAAVRRADSARAFPAAPEGPPWEQGRIVLQLARWWPSRPAGAGLMQVSIPMIVVDSPVTIVNLPRPAYPVSRQHAGVEGAVDLHYAVGTNGRVIPGSVRVIAGEYHDFAAAAIRAVERGRFTPARVRGCAIPMQVRQRMSFSIR